ncbi:HNH endonuclease [Candidatus Gracilibacteria bacterium]|nr:HNH endonuclease [Candidatus Gracilibacteria bacterium]
MDLKLAIELIPATCWYKNIRKLADKERWDIIRNLCYGKAHHRCAICGFQEKGKMHCHEIWEYDDVRKIQKLKGFKCLCEDCHMIKHIGLANIKSSQGELDMKKLISHFLKVNQVDKSVFEKHYDECAKQWKQRSKYYWKMDLGQWSKIVPETKNL